jgi:sugar lactone lactonase YvrE
MQTMKKLSQNIIFIILSFVVPLFCGSQDTESVKSNYVNSITDGIKSPLRLTAASDNSFFVTDYVKRCICRYDSSGKLLAQIKPGFSPLSIASFNADRIYVGSAKNGRITIFDMDGTVIKSFGDFQQPSDAVFDDDNFLYIADSKKGAVSVYSTEGIHQRTFGADILFYPTGITFDQKNQRILVAEHGGITPPDSSGPVATIHIFSKNGEWLGHFGSYGNKEGQFTRIQGLAVDQTGRIYVVDSFQGSITVLDENGNFLERIGEFGSAPGQLRLPTDVLIDSNNRLWITSLNNGSIEVFNLDGFPTGIAGEPVSTVPLQNQLLQNYPNPFNPGTRIPFIIAGNEDVTINIYNLSGQRIRSIDLGVINSGKYTSEGKAVYWDGKNSAGKTVASGFYFYELRSESFSKVRRMLLLK